MDKSVFVESFHAKRKEAFCEFIKKKTKCSSYGDEKILKMLETVFYEGFHAGAEFVAEHINNEFVDFKKQFLKNE